MVTHSRASASPVGLLPLNLPQPAAVEEDKRGMPSAELTHGVLRRVTAISEMWRIDDEWWRAEISRQYYLVELEGGTRVTIFQDLVTRAWYAQSYTAPARLKAG